MEAAIEKQVDRTWQSKTSLIVLVLTILGGYYALTGKFEDDGKKYENHEVRIGQLEADKIVNNGKGSKKKSRRFRRLKDRS